MEAPSGECHHRLAEELAHRRVRLDEVADLFDRGFPVDGEVALAELLGDPRSHHVHAEDSTAGAGGGILLGDDLHEAFWLADDHGSAVAGEGGRLGGPAGSPTIMARRWPEKRCFEVTTSTPASLADCSE